MLCTHCKTELPDGSGFCLKCGHKQKVKTSSTASRLRPIGYMALGVLIAAIAFFAWRAVAKRGAGGTASTPATVGTIAAAPASAAAILPAKPRVLSAQEIFEKASPSMALIETFNDEGHALEQGSGFVVSGSGEIVTNYHVIRGASRAEAKFGDGTTGEISGVLAFDRTHDVAVLELGSPAKAFLQIGNSDAVKVGEKIVAIGSPLGLQNTLSEGIVSGLRDGIIQMSSPISPGSSGGAVFDRYGKVVGISVATVAAGQNLNFAVPINWAKAYLNGGNPQTFADIISQNTITNDLLDSSVIVPANQYKAWTLVVNRNLMNNVEIEGQISSSGGMSGQISLDVIHQGQSQPVYSCRSTSCTVDKKLMAPGTYLVVLDNRKSSLFARTVTGKISEKYVQ